LLHPNQLKKNVKKRTPNKSFEMKSIDKTDEIPPALNSFQAEAMFDSIFFSHQNKTK